MMTDGLGSKYPVDSMSVGKRGGGSTVLPGVKPLKRKLS
jgi:hypothetical protein